MLKCSMCGNEGAMLELRMQLFWLNDPRNKPIGTVPSLLFCNRACLEACKTVKIVPIIAAQLSEEA